MSRRTVLALSVAAVACIAGALAWFATTHGDRASNIRGTVASIDRSTNTLVIATETATADGSNCHHSSRAGDPAVGCPPGLPAAANVTVRIASTTHLQKCGSTSKCAPASLADIRTGQRVVLVATHSADGLTAGQVSVYDR